MNDRKELHDIIKKLTSETLAKIFAAASGEAVHEISGDQEGFMSKMRPDEAMDAVIMMGQMQDELLEQLAKLLEGMAAAPIPKMKAFSLEIGAFIAENNLKIVDDMMESLLDGGKDRPEMAIRPEHTH